MTTSSRLLEKYSILENGCWMYLGGWNGRGYGNIWDNGKTRSAHVVAYEIYRGSTNGLQVLHTCDHRWCINPDHLFLGTQQDNIDDMVNKGRDSFCGIRNGRALLTEEQVSMVKYLLDIGECSQQTIAGMFGVSRGAISAINTGRNWGAL